MKEEKYSLQQKGTKPPSKLLLLWLHLTQCIIWYCQWQWPWIALNATNHFDDYCSSKYFNGYNSPNCNATEMTMCYDDMKCGLKHDFFGYDDNFFCSTSSDCSNCECVAAQRYNSTMISLFVFLGFGMFLEFIRLIMAICVLATGLHRNDNILFLSSIADGIQLRAVQIMNPTKYKKEIIGIHYYQRTLFTFKSCFQPWHIADFLIHQLPVHICVFVLLGSDGFSDESSYQYIFVFVSLLLYIGNNILKMRFTNGLPYISLDVAPQFVAPNLIKTEPMQKSAVIIASYNAIENNQLSVTEGEMVTVIGKPNNFGWVLVSNNIGQTGFVPFGYLQIDQVTIIKPKKKGSLLNEIEGDQRWRLLDQNQSNNAMNYGQ